MPASGLGTWQITDRGVLRATVLAAYETGYRLFDLAAAYGNELSFGKILKEGSIQRKDLFLSDKAWNTSRGYANVIEACKKSLKKLKTDYLDLYLVHWPASMKLYENWDEINADTWRGMEDLYRFGLVRAIGVCNFKLHHLEELKKTAEIMPMVNQFEFHPGIHEKELESYCSANGIQKEASSPLGNGRILRNEVIVNVAQKYHRSPAQVCLRYALDKGFIVIPKTMKLERLKENLDAEGFHLNPDEIFEIDALPFCGGLGIDSDEETEFG